MYNILYQELPTEWNGYKINTGFHIGVQISILIDDTTVTDEMKAYILAMLLFGDEDGSIRESPETAEEIEECLNWFLNGWNMDNDVKDDSDRNQRVMDYTVDQGRIYADFLSVYGIDLEKVEMHWWKFQWLLWNMPHEKSSFLKVIEYRTEKPRKGASAEEKKAISTRQAIYTLKSKPKKKEFSDEEISKIDEVDKLLSVQKSKKVEE